jgi:hypothetical protein
MLVLVAVLSIAARFVAAEAEQLGQLGGLVRLENEAAIARDSAEEKDLALTMLHRWGLGSERQFMELAGKRPLLHPGWNRRNIVKELSPGPPRPGPNIAPHLLFMCNALQIT